MALKPTVPLRHWVGSSRMAFHMTSVIMAAASLGLGQPMAFKASTNATGASNMKGFEPCVCSGATGVSRFTKPKLAFSKTSLTSLKSAPQPCAPSPAAAAAARMASCGMTSPATAKLTWANSCGYGTTAAAEWLAWTASETAPIVAATSSRLAPASRQRLRINLIIPSANSCLFQTAKWNALRIQVRRVEARNRTG